MKKILIVINTAFVSYGGLASVVLNYYKNMDKDDLHIDFASSNLDIEDNLRQLLDQNGSQYYSLGLRRGNSINYFKNLYNLLKKEKYDVVHINGNSSIMAIDLFIAWLNRIPKRIAHGHTSASDFPVLHEIFKPFLNLFCTTRIAVSEKTGKWLYNNKYIILNNAIDIDKYSYSKYKDKKIRRELNLDNSFVIGHVGKLMKAKNHDFLIELFNEYLIDHQNAKLVLVGGGELEEPLKLKCKELGIDRSVIFLGMRSDVADILNIFNVFIFPSLYEGLGMSLIEAQANGLKCIASKNVPLETNVTNNVKYLKLENIREWIAYLNTIKIYDKEELSKNSTKTITEHGYNIKVEANKLRRIYLES